VDGPKLPAHCCGRPTGGQNALAQKRRLVLGDLSMACRAFKALKQHHTYTGKCGARSARPSLLCWYLGQFDANGDALPAWPKPRRPADGP
jgi:hypothetical protein